VSENAIRIALSFRLGTALALATLGLIVGCGPSAKVARPVRIPAKSVAATPAVEQSSEVSPETSDAVEPVQSEDGKAESNTVANPDETSSAPSEPSNTAAKLADTSDAETSNPSDATSEESADAEPPAKPIPAERIMLLTDAGPILIDLHMTIDGLPYQESFTKVVDDVMKIADDDDDGIVAWDDIMAHPRFRQGQFGNPASTTYQASQEMIRQYDTTKNGRVDPDELVRYLGSGQTTSNAMILYTSNYRRTLNRDASPIRRWLDKNDDLTLDAEEIKNATNRLRLRDANDDDVLLESELSESNASQNNMVARRRPGDTQYMPKVGWHLDSNVLWSDIRVAWGDFFALGQSVQKNDLGITSSIFGQIDIDDDQELDNIDMEMLAEIEPHLSIQIELATGDSQQAATVELKAMRLPSDDIESIVQQPNRITLNLAKTSIDIFAKDLIGFAAYDQQAMGFLQQADGDKNGYLDEDEFGQVAQFVNGVEFAVADLDENAQVTEDELITLLKQRNIVSRNQVSVRADDQDDALFPSIDLNSDGRIDSREMAAVEDSLLALDGNGDGEVDLHELQGSMLVGVVRGGNRGTILNGDTTFQVPQAAARPSESTPPWFIAMDRNRDQGISWREFLGTRQQFNELDTDHDGFLVADEAHKPETEATTE